MNIFTKLIAAGAIAGSIFFFNYNKLDKQPALYLVNELTEEEEYLNVEFLVVTPCLKEGECYNFNNGILEEADRFYKRHGIDVDFRKKEVVVDGELNIEYSSLADPMYGFELKMALINDTGEEVPFILHAPMYKGDVNNTVLGVANQYLQIIVLDQEMIDAYSNSIEAHVLIHEIGHIFGLKDIYNPNSCNLMDGILTEKALLCQRLTPEQVNKMHFDIENFLIPQ